MSFSVAGIHVLIPWPPSVECSLYHLRTLLLVIEWSLDNRSFCRASPKPDLFCPTAPLSSLIPLLPLCHPCEDRPYKFCLLICHMCMDEDAIWICSRWKSQYVPVTPELWMWLLDQMLCCSSSQHAFLSLNQRGHTYRWMSYRSLTSW